jgi:purine-binding chemotaxis protein CheW
MNIEHDIMMEGHSSTDNTIKDQYLTFVIDDEEYGVEIAKVREIVPMSPITWVPEMPNYIEGLYNLRGELIGVLDVRKRFGLAPKEYDEDTCIIVIIAGDTLGQLGLIVDAVRETAIIPESKMAPPPNARMSYVNQFIRNIGRVGDDEFNVKLLLDLEKFLND